MSGKNITRRLGDLPRGHQCRTSAFILDASVVNHSCDSANGYWRKNPATLARPVPIAEIDPGLPREDEEGDAVPSHLKRLSTGQIGVRWQQSFLLLAGSHCCLPRRPSAAGLMGFAAFNLFCGHHITVSRPTPRTSTSTSSPRTGGLA